MLIVKVQVALIGLDVPYLCIEALLRHIVRDDLLETGRASSEGRVTFQYEVLLASKQPADHVATRRPVIDVPHVVDGGHRGV